MLKKQNVFRMIKYFFANKKATIYACVMCILGLAVGIVTPICNKLLQQDIIPNKNKQITLPYAITWSNVSTYEPFALYWFIIIIVLAGAVAIESTAKMSVTDHSRLNINLSIKIMSSAVITISKRVIFKTFFPSFTRYIIYDKWYKEKD